MIEFIVALWAVAAMQGSHSGSGAARPYNPLDADPRTVHTLYLAVHDTARHRDIPICIYLPAERTPAPVILFSPGLGGSRSNYAYLGQHWAARGYCVVVLQHPGSDDAVWRGKRPLQAFADLRAAASLQNFLLRVQDVRTVLDHLAKWHRQKGHPLFAHLDMAHVGMAGHSFGAVTTQAVSGQAFGMLGQVYTDARIRAAIVMSPSAPRFGSPEAAFGKVRIPWMIMTGTDDSSPLGRTDAASRQKVFEGLPAKDKYQLVLFQAEHSAFSDRALPGERRPRNPNHHRAILALSTAFWDAYLRSDSKAKTWLRSNAARSVLEPRDRWEAK